MEAFNEGLQFSLDPSYILSAKKVSVSSFRSVSYDEI